MTRKDFLTKRHKKLLAKRDALIARSNASTDAAELRSINEQISDINDEIENVTDELAVINAEEQRSADDENSRVDNTPVPENAEHRNATLRASYTAPAQTRSANDEDDHPTNSIEYRRAFREYVCRGTQIPANLQVRAGEAISTKETGVMIPFTIVNQVINTIRVRYGNLYSKVRKTSVPGGVGYSRGALSAEFYWKTEGTATPRQRTNGLDRITFGYNIAELRIAQTFLSNLLTLSAFEAELSRVIAIAYLKLCDKSIVSGTGNGSMTGILNDPSVTNTVEMSAADLNDWTKWRKNFFAKLPLGYRDGEFIFPVSTVDTYLETIADANGNPIFRQATGLEVNSGDAQNPNGRFFGHDIALVEPTVIPDFDTASVNDVVGIFWQPQEYAINENFGFMMRRYYDEETDEWVDKALVVIDGKVLNPEGFYKIIKKA